MLQFAWLCKSKDGSTCVKTATQKPVGYAQAKKFATTNDAFKCKREQHHKKMAKKYGYK